MSLIETAETRIANRAVEAANWIPFGISFLDEALLGISPNDLVLLGAHTGVGKTQIATHVAMNAVSQYKRVRFYALEAEDGEIQDRAVWNEMCRRFYKRNPHGQPGIDLRYRAWRRGDLQSLQDLEIEVTRELNTKFLELETIYQKGGYTVENFVESLEGIGDVSLIVVDHMHYFDMDDENEVRALRRAVKQIRKAVLHLKKPVLLLAHLRKSDRMQKSPVPDIDDFYGSSDLTKIATQVIIASRAEEEAKSAFMRPTWLYIAKSRDAGETQGYSGLCSYNLREGRYNANYLLARVRRGADPEIMEGSRIPRWAKGANDPKANPPSPQERLI